MRKKRGNMLPVLKDIGIIVISICVAILMIRTHALHGILALTQDLYFLESFLAGIFFTSIFTTPLAIVALAEISHDFGIVNTAVWGALGSLCGDYVIFLFVKDHLSEHILAVLKHQGIWRRSRHLFRRRIFRRLTFVVGGLIIASPLPDELGIALMGFSKMRTSLFLVLSLVFNFLGILFVGYMAS